MGEDPLKYFNIDPNEPEDDLDDSWYEGQVWRRPEEVIPEEEPILLSRAQQEMPVLPRVKPAQFAQFAFRFPAADEEGLGVDGSGYDRFSFDGRRHMRRLYDTPAKRILLFCGRQVEKSTLLGNRALCYMSLVKDFRVLYVSASATQAKKFSADRIREPIETSPVLRKFTTTMLSSNILEKQFVNRSQITMRYAYLNADRTRGIPADLLCIDEFQDILGENIPVIEQCLSHGRERWKMYLYAGTPKSLDNNLEKYWSSYSTQNEWVVPHDCKKGEGGRYWNEGLNEKNIGKRGLICANCGVLIDPMCEDAQWAMTGQPDADFEGYRIPQLMVPWVDWKHDIILNYERYPRDKFYNEVLGLSYDSGLRPLTRAQVRDCCVPDLSMEDIQSYRQLAYGQSIYAGIDWGCHDEDTRVLTEEGFKYFADLTDDDKVAQWDPDTRKMTFVKPKVRTVRDWEQPLLHFKTKGGMDLMVTHTHRMRVGRMQGQSWVTESAGDTALRGGPVHFVGWVAWDGEDVETFELPGLPVSPGYQGCEPKVFSMDEWVEFLGYMLTEGGVCLKKNSKGELVPYCLKMSQRQTVNPKNYERIRYCMESLDIPFTEFPNPKTGDANWAIYGKQLWDWFSRNMGMTGDTKRIPRQFLKLSRHQLQILFDAMVLGDGYTDPRENCTGGAYYSTSKGLCEDFQEVCIKLGLRCSVSLHKPAEGNRKARYRALWSAGRDYHLNTPSRKVKKVPYKGKVYCCAVPTGYIVTERNGKIAYQGNTGENSYTVIVLATYIDMKFRVFFAHRFVGEETDPDVQLARIKELITYFNVKLIGCDYGGGYDRNHHLVRAFGPKRVWTFQHLGRVKKKVEYDPKMGRFKVSRAEVMGDIFNAIKRRRCEFPRWEEWQEPFAQDMLNIFGEFNETLRITQYKHATDNPDDTFHSFMYAWLVSMLEHPRPDIITPNKEIDGQIVSQYRGPLDQG